MLRLDAGLADHGVAHALRLVAEPPANVILATEGLHHLDAHHGLVRGLGDVALARLNLPRDRHHQVGEAPGDERDQRCCHAGVQGQPRVDRRQNDGAADDHHGALHALHDAPADEVPDREQVVGRPRDDLAGRVPVEERARKPQVAREQHLAQLGLDPHADPGGRVAAGEVDPEADHRQHHDRDHVRPDVARVARDDGVVDRPLDQDGDPQRQADVDECAEQRQQDQGPLAPPEGCQPARGRPGRIVRGIDLNHGEDAAGPASHVDEMQLPALPRRTMQSSRMPACNNGVRPRCYTRSSGGSRRGTGVALITDVVVSP